MKQLKVEKIGKKYTIRLYGQDWELILPKSTPKKAIKPKKVSKSNKKK